MSTQIQLKGEAYTLKPFSPPPLCVVDPRTVIHKGEPVWVLGEGNVITKGTLHSKEITAKYMLLDVDDQNEPLQVDFATVKMINMSTFKQWIGMPQMQTDVVDITPCEDIKFVITFTDDDELRGKTRGFNYDSNGLYLFPTQKQGYFSYTFIPHHVIANYQVGPKIGEQLIKDKLVSAEDVNAARMEWNGIRSQLLGEYFKRNALVTTQEMENAIRDQKSIPDISLGDLLVKSGQITEEQLALAVEEQNKDRSISLGEILVNSGKITALQLHQSQANKMGIPFVDISKLDIDHDVHAMVPENTARSYNIMPLHIFNGKLIVTMEDPLNWKVLEAIRFSAGKDIIPVMAFHDDIAHAIDVHYTAESDDYYTSVDLEEAEEDILDESASSTNLIVRLANKIVIDAYQQNASDIHLEPNPEKKKITIRFRKDGGLIPYHELSARLRRSLVARYKIMANMDITERRLPQDGKINFGRYSRLKIELRVVTIPTTGGEEDIIIRILAAGKPIPINEMQLSKDNLGCIKYVLKNPHGLFIVCGPTGSGKTTLLHSLLSHLNTPDKKIWTVEDPVEITQQGLRQVQTQHNIGLGFSRALLSFLRGDPDIIMVGEMRDEETVKMVIEASLTGHLVLSTLHTNGAVESVVRLLEMGVEPYNFSDALLGVVAQRLVKRLCNVCKQPRTVDETDLTDLLNEYLDPYKHAGIADKKKFDPLNIMNKWKEQYADNKGKFTLYDAVGCKSCGDVGYIGRFGIHEMLMTGDQIQMAIYRKENTQKILAMALDEGMTTLKQDGIEKILQGHTDLRQIRVVT